MRIVRIWANLVKLGICLALLFVLLFMLQLLYQTDDFEHNPRGQQNNKLPAKQPDAASVKHNKPQPQQQHRKAIKDAVFDKQSLRDANPLRDNKVLQMGRNPFLPEDGTGPRRHPIIPHILHQVWDSDEATPAVFVPWIQSWQRDHPSWEHWLWTPVAVQCLLEKHYPDYSALFDAYPDDISRADVTRYFVLHHYGGVYVDLDTISLKPLDPWTYRHQCILSEEPYEHPFLVRDANRSNIVNSPLACRPRHPFFDAAIKALPEAAAQYFGDFLHSTGPFFLDSVLRDYQHHHHEDPQDNITVVPPRYFLPTYDKSQTGIIDDKCSPQFYKSLPDKQKWVCDMLMQRDYKNSVYPDSFMDHRWMHVNMMDLKWKYKDTVRLENINPKIKKMSMVLCTNEHFPG